MEQQKTSKRSCVKPFQRDHPSPNLHIPTEKRKKCQHVDLQVSTIPACNFPGTNLTVSCKGPLRCTSKILPGEICIGWFGSSAATSAVRSKSADGGQKDSKRWSRWWCRGKVSCKSDNLQGFVLFFGGRLKTWCLLFPRMMDYNECMYM